MKILACIGLFYFVGSATFALPTKELVLNGTGIRKATLFKVHVYEASLYLTNKSSDANAILASSEPKKMDLRFVRSVDGSDIADAWETGFKKNCETACAAAEPALKQLKAAMTDVKEGDRQTYSFDAKGVSYSLNGKQIVQITNPDFGKVLLSMWIGKEPPNADLREGLLGLAK